MLAIQMKKIKLWALIVFAIPLISLSISGQDGKLDIPAIGDRVSGVVSLEQEKAIGSQFLKQVYAQAPMINDPLIQEYTELLIYRISETSLVKDRDFKLVLIDDRSLNAFAYDRAGNRGISLGLNNIQKLADGERLDGRLKAEDDFEALDHKTSELDEMLS